MSKIGLVSALGFSVLCYSAALSRAEVGDADRFMRCADILDDNDRLGCFDAASKVAPINKQAPVNPKIADSGAANYPEMDLIDLKVDADKLIGKRVSISGNVLLFSNIAFIRKNLSDTSNLFIQIDKLPRDQRKAIFEDCTGAGCQARVRGVVARVLGQGGIVAEQVTVGGE